MRTFRYLLTCLLLFPALLALDGGSRGEPASGRRVEVIASLPNLASIASAVGGDRVTVTSIATGAQDAHFIDPKPSYMARLRKADLLLINGLELEIGWIPPITEGARNPKIQRGAPGYVDCSAGIPVVEVPASLSRAEGDVHPYGNPHYLSDPLNAEIVAGTIEAALSKADPAGAAAYEVGRKAFVNKLHESLFGKDLVEAVGGAKLSREAAAGRLDALLGGTSIGGKPLRTKLGGWLGKMQAVRGLPIVTYHKDYSYFAKRYGIRVIDYVEPKPGIPPSPKHLDELVTRLENGEARVVVTRPYLEHRSTDYLAKKTGATVITLPLEVGGAPEATDFFKLNDLVVDRLAKALTAAKD